MKLIKSLIPYIIIIVVVVFIRTFIVTPVTVDGSSMYPTLKNKDILLLNKYDHHYEYGDIVVLKYAKSRLVKRIIGVPGDTVRISNGKLYINEKEVKDTFSTITSDFDLKNYGYEKIPENYYFVLGDNRNASSDSRVLGLFRKSDILGTTTFRIFPFDSFGKIK